MPDKRTMAKRRKVMALPSEQPPFVTELFAYYIDWREFHNDVMLCKSRKEYDAAEARFKAREMERFKAVQDKYVKRQIDRLRQQGFSICPKCELWTRAPQHCPHCGALKSGAQ